MADSVNMSLDEIIKKNKQFRASRTRGRGGTGRGRGGGRGGVRGRGQSRPGTPVETRSQYQARGRRSQSRSRSQSRARSQSRVRSRSRQRRSNSRGRSASRSRSQLRRITPKGRAGLDDQHVAMPPLMRGKPRGGGIQYKLRGRGRGNGKIRGGLQQFQGVHSRLGVVTRRGAAYLNQPLAVAKRGISKRGRGLTTGNRYSAVGLRSDQILKQQRQHLIQQSNIIRSQTFRRSRNNSFNDVSQLTVSVKNDFVKRRRNSMGSNSYLNKRSLAQLNTHYGGFNVKRGPGSVHSTGSYRSNRSNNSNRSNSSARSGRSRGRGRGGRGGVGRKFVSKQYLDAKLQKEIAALQSKNNKEHSELDLTLDGNFTPTPASTGQTLHQRFGL